MPRSKKATPPILDDYSNNAEEFHNPLFTENEVQYDEVENEPYSTLSNNFNDSEGELYPYPLSTDNQDEVDYDEVDYDEVDYDEVEEEIEQYDTLGEQEATDHYKADEEKTNLIYDEMQEEGEMDV